MCGNTHALREIITCVSLNYPCTDEKESWTAPFVILDHSSLLSASDTGNHSADNVLPTARPVWYSFTFPSRRYWTPICTVLKEIITGGNQFHAETQARHMIWIYELAVLAAYHTCIVKLLAHNAWARINNNTLRILWRRTYYNYNKTLSILWRRSYYNYNKTLSILWRRSYCNYNKTLRILWRRSYCNYNKTCC